MASRDKLFAPFGKRNSGSPRIAALGATKDLLDRFGRPIREGDVILITGRGDLLWTVTEITPILDPNAPAGAVRVNFAVSLTSGVQTGMPVVDFIRVRERHEYAGDEPAPSGDSGITEEAGEPDPGDTPQEPPPS